MTIQLPVLIWTVICFCVFMLVLDRLLFKPLLRFMDKRREKMECAELLERQRLRRLEALRLEDEADRRSREAAEEAARQKELLRAKAEEELRSYSASLESDAVRRRAELEAESARMEREAAAGLDAHVAAYTDKLASYGEL